MFFNYIGIPQVMESKVAIITGARSGIGYATSLALSKAGIRAAVGARRTLRLQELESKLSIVLEKSLQKILTNQTNKRKVEILKAVTPAARRYTDNNEGKVRFENEAILIAGKK
jgi:NADP-dependent 3-hydroxy acid dehydrogenase YdfG